MSEYPFPTMRQYKYILVGHDPVPCDDLMKWAKAFKSNDRIVQKTNVVCDSGDEAEVSTVFLGLDHNHAGVGEPILFETMVFGGILHEWCWRYCTWEEAEQGHAQAVQLTKTTEVLGDGDLDAQRAAELAATVIAAHMSKKPGG